MKCILYIGNGTNVLLLRLESDILGQSTCTNINVKLYELHYCSRGMHISNYFTMHNISNYFTMHNISNYFTILYT